MFVIFLCLVLLGVLFFFVVVVWVVEFCLELLGGMQIWSSEELFRYLQVCDLDILVDVVYCWNMCYCVVLLVVLLKGVYFEDYLQVVVSDGFVVELLVVLLFVEQGL